MPSFPLPSEKHIVRAGEWAAVRLFAMDVDGVLTDGSLYISSTGVEAKAFNVLDGMGLARLRLSGITTAWISGRSSGATLARADELKIPHLIQGRSDKHVALQELADSLGFAAGQCAYMGDDDIDVAAIRWAGIGVSVPDGMPVAIAAARYVTTRRAGHGAVREVCEHILSAKGLSFVP